LSKRERGKKKENIRKQKKEGEKARDLIENR